MYGPYCLHRTCGDFRIKIQFLFIKFQSPLMSLLAMNLYMIELIKQFDLVILNLQ